VGDGPGGAGRKKPILCYVHGGAWTKGHSTWHSLPLLYELAQQGWLVASVNYRLAPRVPFPYCLRDVKRAIHWLRTNAVALHPDADPSFIAVAGESAGGHLSLLAGLTPNVAAYQDPIPPAAGSHAAGSHTAEAKDAESMDTEVQAVVDLYGVTDFTDHRNQWLRRTPVGAGLPFPQPTTATAAAADAMGPTQSSSGEHVAARMQQRPGHLKDAGIRHFAAKVVLRRAYDDHRHEFVRASPLYWVAGRRLGEALHAAGIELPAADTEPAPAASQQRQGNGKGKGTGGAPRDTKQDETPAAEDAERDVLVTGPAESHAFSAAPAGHRHGHHASVHDMAQDRPVPPILMVHGDIDTVVPVEDSDMFWSALKQRRARDSPSGSNAAGTDAFIRLDRAHHAYNFFVSPRAVNLSDAVADYLGHVYKAHVGNKKSE
jgi:acetyl esterase/lipase